MINSLVKNFGLSKAANGDYVATIIELLYLVAKYL